MFVNEMKLHTIVLASRTDLVSNIPSVSNSRLFSSIFFCLSLSYSVKYNSEDMMITIPPAVVCGARGKPTQEHFSCAVFPRMACLMDD